jgi:hypothetical protein
MSSIAHRYERRTRFSGQGHSRRIDHVRECVRFPSDRYDSGDAIKLADSSAPAMQPDAFCRENGGIRRQ